MAVVEVNSPKLWKTFHQIPHEIYKNIKHWVSPLHEDIESILHPEKHKISGGEVISWIYFDDQNKPQGRISAFIDHDKNKQRGINAGGMGFFQCVNNPDIANTLLQTAENWLSDRGVDFVDGPINFGEREKFWGLLERGYEFRPIFQEYYHHPYLKQFLVDRGYEKLEQVLTLSGNMVDVPIDRFIRLGERAKKLYPFTVEYLDPKRLDKYANDFAAIYNEAFKANPYFKPLSGDQVLQALGSLKPIMDPKMICFCYFDNIPVGFCAIVPDINKYLRQAKGKLNWRTLPAFLLKLKFDKKRDGKGIAFGIHPDYQRKGTYAVICEDMWKNSSNFDYERLVLATIRGHNSVMVKTTSGLGVRVEREHYTYRKPLKAGVTVEPFEFYEEA